jgi:hypothetical protein
MKRLASALAALCLSATLVSAQSLVEIAKKEKERRKKLDAAGKQAFTENDLRGGPRFPAAAPAKSEEAAPPAAVAVEAGSADAAAEVDPTTTQSYWRERVSGVNKKIQELEARLSSPELNSDRRGADRRQAAERDLAQARTEKEAISDEARRKGIPPGWLR